MNIISFPGLGIQFEINPVAFSIGGIEVYWYGLIIVFGILLTPIFAKFRLKYVGLNMDDVFDLLIFCLPAALIGCRVYYCLFYNFDYYINNPLKIITGITDGGLAFYGGLIAAILVGFIVMKVKKKHFFDATDLAMPMFLLAQGIGRWGNFCNGEAYGSQTDLPWRMIVDGIHNSTNGVGVHPCFFYESISCLIGFAVLYFLIFPHRKFRGELTACYMIWYGTERFFVEGLRADSLYLGASSLRISQAVSLVLVIIGIIWLVIGLIRSKKHPLVVDTAEIEASSDDDEYQPIIDGLTESESSDELDELGELEKLSELEDAEGLAELEKLESELTEPDEEVNTEE